MTLPHSIDETLALLLAENYIAERSLATSVFLGVRLERPIFAKGEAGVGKTELAKALGKV